MKWNEVKKTHIYKMVSHPAFRTAPVQLNEAAAVPVAFALYGDAMTLSPSSSSDTAVVKLIRSSSEIYKWKRGKPRKRQKFMTLSSSYRNGIKSNATEIKRRRKNEKRSQNHDRLHERRSQHVNAHCAIFQYTINGEMMSVKCFFRHGFSLPGSEINRNNNISNTISNSK